MNLFSKSLIILSLLFSGVAFATPSDQVSGCTSAFNQVGDNVTVKPFDSTICSHDKMTQLMFQLFPVASELVSSPAVFDLENREAFIQHAIKEQEERSYSVRLDAVEASGVTITNLLKGFAKLAFVFFMLAGMYKAMSGNKSSSLVGYLAISCVCFVLTYPLAVGGRINPQGETNLATSIGVGFVFAGIGMSNQVISSTVHLMTVGGIRNDIVKGLEIEPEIARPYAQAKEWVEEAMCLDSVALADVYLSADRERMGSKTSIMRGGQLESLAFKDDGVSSRFKIDFDKQKTLIESGWRLDDKEHRSVCVSRNLLQPAATNLSDDVTREADKIADKLSLADIKASKLTAAWQELKNSLNDASVAEKLSASDYLFSRILWRLDGGDAATNEDSRTLFNNRAALASEFAREIRAGKCYADYRGFQNTERTIKKMNNGSVGGSEFNLDCAIVRNGQLETIFDGDTSSAQDFADKGLMAMSEHPYRAVEMHNKLMDSFEVESLVKRTLVSLQADIHAAEAIKETNDNGFYDRAIAARAQGVMMFGVNGIRLMEAWLNAQGLMLNSQPEISNIESSVTKDTFYAGENGFLPKGVEFSMSEMIMPAFIYHVPSNTDNNSTAIALVESQLASQLDGGQGGTAASMVKNTGQIYESAGAESTTTQTEVLDQSAGTIIDSLTTTALKISSTKGLSAGEIRRATNQMCMSSNTSASDIEKLGISTGEYNAICERNSILALTHYKNLGFRAVDHAGALMIVGTSAIAGDKLMKMYKRKKTDKGADKGNVETDGSIAGNVLPKGAMPASVESKVVGAMAGLANVSFIQYVSGMLVGMTLVFASVTTVVYLLPSLLFSFSVVSLLFFIVIFCALSGVVACALVIFGGKVDHIRKLIASGIVNLLLRPLLMVVMLYVAVGAVQLADLLANLVSVSSVGQSGKGLGFASHLMFTLIFACINLIFVFWLLRNAINQGYQAADRLTGVMGATKMGGSDEQTTNTAVVAGANTATQRTQAVGASIAKRVTK